ncbi:MAG: restriction endonuclease [bacterium]|nr:restriction endonuclease [bacterium]
MAPLLKLEPTEWIQAFRSITNATNERTIITSSLPESGVGNSSPTMDYTEARAFATLLVMANMNSLPLDWAARLSVGGANLNFYLVKQFPVLPPEAYLESPSPGQPSYAQIIAPKVLELTFTAWELEPFARDLGYEGPPFEWDEERRHRLKCELDAIYARMYGLDRSDLEHILDAPPPSASFPALKRNEIKRFGEYRTQRYVLTAFDHLQNGQLPDLRIDPGAGSA